uniref:Uncharacterized protein n=1 Tax=Aegilops tauschii subsp. strangulata TaxID=200361 RepID=A0A453MCA7_AEGTS
MFPEGAGWPGCGHYDVVAVMDFGVDVKAASGGIFWSACGCRGHGCGLVAICSLIGR